MISSAVPSASFLAFGHDNHRIAKIGNEIHVMFDHAECITALLVEAPDCAADGFEQGTVYTCADFIEKHDLGIDHHGAAKFQQFFLSAGKIACKFIGNLGDFQKLDDIARRERELPLPPRAPLKA